MPVLAVFLLRKGEMLAKQKQMLLSNQSDHPALRNDDLFVSSLIQHAIGTFSEA